MNEDVSLKRGLLDLIIARMNGLRPAQKCALVRSVSREEELFGLSPEEIGFRASKQGELPLKTLSFDLNRARSAAEKDLAAMRRTGIKAVSPADDDYPVLLKEIYDPPPLIFYRGTLPASGAKLVAIVGTRRPSAAALRWTYDLAKDLAKAGVAAVSGLALGIDAIAHRGNMDGGGATCAVLGSAPDVIVPISNRHIASRILCEGGAIISEYPPGTPPKPWQFPARNRIISGLCRSVLVACAPKRSGALITAEFAAEQNRDLFASGGGFAGEGCLRLISEGATEVNDGIDFLKKANIV